MCVRAFGLRLAPVCVCVCTCLFVHLLLSQVSVHGEDHMHTNTFSSPTVRTIITRDQKRGGELDLKLHRTSGRNGGLIFIIIIFFLYILPEVYTSRLWNALSGGRKSWRADADLKKKHI